VLPLESARDVPKFSHKTDTLSLPLPEIDPVVHLPSSRTYKTNPTRGALLLLAKKYYNLLLLLRFVMNFITWMRFL
jgi:hypothetical protein